MTDHNTTDLQGSIKEQHRQGSLHPADPDMQLSGKGYSQNRIDPAGQSSLSGEQTGADVQRSGKGEHKKSGEVQRLIAPVAIAFVLGILVTILVFRTINAHSSNENEGTAASAGIEEPAASDDGKAIKEEVGETEEEAQEQKENTPSEEEVTETKETIAPDAVVEIPDPVLKKALQDALGIGEREITVEDALSLTEFKYDGYQRDSIKDITGLSSFKYLTYLNLSHNELSDISALSGLTNLTTLWLARNPVLQYMSREEIREVLSRAENLTVHY